jgi:hypothetical protein
MASVRRSLIPAISSAAYEFLNIKRARQRARQGRGQGRKEGRRESREKRAERREQRGNRGKRAEIKEHRADLLWADGRGLCFRFPRLFQLMLVFILVPAKTMTQSTKQVPSSKPGSATFVDLFWTHSCSS